MSSLLFGGGGTVIEHAMHERIAPSHYRKTKTSLQGVKQVRQVAGNPNIKTSDRVHNFSQTKKKTTRETSSLFFFKPKARGFPQQ